MSAVIERVARAIGGSVWSIASDRMRQQFREQARDAISAMRDPSDAMLIAIDNTTATVDMNWTREHKRRVIGTAQWNSAISAALKETQ